MKQVMLEAIAHCILTTGSSDPESRSKRSYMLLDTSG
jgi:hypothetical protein